MASPRPEGYCALHDGTECGCGRPIVAPDVALERSIEATLDRWAPALSRLATIEHLANLASCLRQAAGLCAAFEEGWWQHDHHQMYSSHGYRSEQDWRPGCGRAVEGWEAR
jgi:hypothetical protein